MNDFENGTAPVANSLAYLNLKLNDAIEQLNTLSARVDRLYDDLGFFSHSVNNVEMLIKRISHDMHEKTEEHPPVRFRDIANGE